jgi:hypothetical protein
MADPPVRLLNFVSENEVTLLIKPSSSCRRDGGREEERKTMGIKKHRMKPREKAGRRVTWGEGVLLWDLFVCAVGGGQRERCGTTG